MIFRLLISTLLLFFSTGAVFAAARPAVQPLCNDTQYTCIKTLKGETWETLFADSELRNLVKRVNRMNVQIQPGMLIAVPNNLDNVTMMDFAPFDKQIAATGRKLVVVEPQKFAWGAYDTTGKLINWGPVSMGKNFCSDVGQPCKTKTGEFTVYRKGSAKCVSGKFPIPDGGAPMPYCMFFVGGYALHASTEVPGYHASHGCVRLLLEDARWLNEEFIEVPNAKNGYQGTKVIINSYSV